MVALLARPWPNLQHPSRPPRRVPGPVSVTPTRRAGPPARLSVEERWLDHAWRVVSCPDRHRQLCEAAGGATLRVGAVDGNELRWPGYLGRNYLGILCVGHVHRESTPDGLACQPLRVRRSYAQLEAASRAWLAAGRSPQNDAAYLEAVRRTYEEVLSRWSRWRDFGKVVE